MPRSNTREPPTSQFSPASRDIYVLLHRALILLIIIKLNIHKALIYIYKYVDRYNCPIHGRSSSVGPFSELSTKPFEELHTDEYTGSNDKAFDSQKDLVLELHSGNSLGVWDVASE